ncbi:MAG: glutamine--tRNA ligase/YqeY domain fusion protein [Deltaproteobacteria bacterium]|nr:glutamine--tRNA ligase/YqeY domain fusion protein [Deltaproteobacteria bacterium]
MSTDAPKTAGLDFIRRIIADDLASGKHDTVVTRFPPEPNGYLHIGHAKSIFLNFGLAAEIPGGRCHLRFDDSNPETEDMEYVESIKLDVRWLGLDWGDDLYHASDYFEQLYGFAVALIKAGNAYVCSLSEEEIRRYRGTVTHPGTDSPYRNRSVEENLDLFERMRGGEFADGQHVLRAKIDMTMANMKMRDPLLYRIRHVRHYRTGDTWCIYPMYDFAHCLSDAIEGITHSICTLEFENNREIYDWILNNVPAPCHPRQIEFARLNLSYTVMSKRKLSELVDAGHVSGWDDPRLPTIAGLRRRGVTPEVIRNFCDRIGVAKANSTVDVALLEHSIREDLNTRTPRVMGVLDPLKMVIVNYPEGQVEEFEAPYFPDNPPKMGYRKVPFSRELYIERGDFMENPPRKFFRLAPGREVRLRWAYMVTCVDVKKNEQGEIMEVHCRYDPDTRGGDAPDGRKVKGTIHWVSASNSISAEVRLYDRLFIDPNPDGGKDSDFISHLNPCSLVVAGAKVEPSLRDAGPGERFQFERTGYFCADPEDHTAHRPVFNRIVPLRDSWAKIAAKAKN